MGEYDLTYGSPSAADSVSFLAARGIEIPVDYDPDYYQKFKKVTWGHVAAVDWATALRVYAPSATTFNVAAGKYLFRGEVKTYAPSTDVDPTDSDTTYVWLKTDNTIDSGIDGSGWPATEHIPLAELDVDSDGVITAIRDLRGQSFMEYNGVGSTRVFTAALTAGSTVQVHNANAPFKYRVLDAWSVARSADAGTWKLTDGTNDITDAVAVTATDKTIDRAGTIDDAYYEIAADGSLSVVGDGSLADVEVYVLVMRIV
jgi:hypothetical protein